MTNDSNNGLYFIVGGLVVLAIIFGFAMWGPYDMSGSTQASVQPAAGSYSESSATRTDQTKVESGNDGSGSVTQTTTTQTNTP